MIGKIVKKIKSAGKSVAKAVKNVVSPEMPKPPKPSKAEVAAGLEAAAQADSDTIRRERDATNVFKGLVGARAFLGGGGFGGFLK